jgi:RecB family exonuclease
VFQRYARARWLAGLVDDRPAGVLRVWLDGEIGGPPLVPEAVERRFEGLEVGPVRLRGTLDRLDRLPDGTRLVTDYKTGGTPTRKQVELGLSLQPVAYAEAVAAGTPVASSFLSLARPDDLRRTGWTGDPAALDVLCTPEERRRALSLDADGRAKVLSRAADGARALVAGRFPPTPHPPELAGCPSCPYRRICRLDPARHGGRGPEVA